MKKTTRKLLSSMMALVMVLSLMGTFALTPATEVKAEENGHVHSADCVHVDPNPEHGNDAHAHGTVIPADLPTPYADIISPEVNAERLKPDANGHVHGDGCVHEEEVIFERSLLLATRCIFCGSYNTYNTTHDVTTYPSAQTGTANWSHTLWTVYKQVDRKTDTHCNNCSNTIQTGSTQISKTIYSYYYKCGQCSGSGASNTTTAYGTWSYWEYAGKRACPNCVEPGTPSEWWIGYDRRTKTDTLKCAAGSCVLTHIVNWEEKCYGCNATSWGSYTY